LSILEEIMKKTPNQDVIYNRYSVLIQRLLDLWVRVWN